MNTKKTFAVIVIVALLLGACVPTSTPAPITPEATPLPRSVGRISAEEKLVESGPGDNLTPVTNTADFFDNDTVRVTNGGVAKLDLLTDQIDNQISIRIFNDTAVGGVKADPSGTTDPIVTLLLVFGGLTGEVPKNGGVPVQFTTPNGVNIFILGTQFLVLYDPQTRITYIGNFDGTIAYSIPGQSVQFIQAGQIYEISPSFEIKTMILNFTRTDIEGRTSNNRSTLLDTLQDYLEPVATPTPTTTPTLSPLITPTPTPSPTITPTPTDISPCDQAAFVTDVTVPDGTSFSPGFQFTKVWRLKNVGTCTWTNSYSLVFYKGDQMGGPTSVNVPSTVAPGQTVDIAVGLVAPALPGSYRGDWMLRNSSGTVFGAGANGTTPIWVKINVVVITVTTPPVGSPDLTVSITSGPTATCDPKILTACITITTVGFVITNAGYADVTSGFQVLIEATGKQSRTITVSGLAAGYSQNFVQDFPGSCFNPDCTARVTVDSNNTILESNETNNIAQNTVTGISTGTITGTSFYDDNSNGLPDPGELVEPNMTVTLYDSTGNTPLTSRITDANGKYDFPNLSPGVYFVGWGASSCSGTPTPTKAPPVTVNAGDTKIEDINLTIFC